MELVNQISLVEQDDSVADDPARLAVLREAVEAAVVLISPIAPHIADELWQRLGGQGFLIEHAWPGYDEKALIKAEKIVVVQVNGKKRAELSLPAETGDEAMKEAALADDKVQSFISGKPVKKIIPVQGKLVNIVI
jgi:leucyl-tRNA synthetase